LRNNRHKKTLNNILISNITAGTVLLIKKLIDQSAKINFAKLIKLEHFFRRIRIIVVRSELQTHKNIITEHFNIKT